MESDHNRRKLKKLREETNSKIIKALEELNDVCDALDHLASERLSEDNIVRIYKKAELAFFNELMNSNSKESE